MTNPLPLRLPAPIYLADPALLAASPDAVHRCPHLAYAHRACVAAHTRHVATLAPPRMAQLATVLTQALLQARNWGRRHGSRTPSLPDTHIGSRPSAAVQAVAESFAIASIVPPGSSVSGMEVACGHMDDPATDRVANQRHECALRQLNECPVTLRAGADECSHLLPHSLAAVVTDDNAAFWFLLALVFGTDVRDEIWQLAGGPRSFSTANAILLDSTLHTYFDKGQIWLVPMPGEAVPITAAGEQQPRPDGEPQQQEWEGVPVSSGVSEDESGDLDKSYEDEGSSDGYGDDDDDDSDNTNEDRESAVPDYYDVELRWMSADVLDFGTLATVPFRQHNAPRPRPLSTGDRFRLSTPDRVRWPLPHPLLLDLRIALWTMIGAAGLAESTATMLKRKSLAEASGQQQPKWRGAIPGACRRGRDSGRHRRPGKRGGGRAGNTTSGGAGPRATNAPQCDVGVKTAVPS